MPHFNLHDEALDLTYEAIGYHLALRIKPIQKRNFLCDARCIAVLELVQSRIR